MDKGSVFSLSLKKMEISEFLIGFKGKMKNLVQEFEDKDFLCSFLSSSF